MRVRTLEAQLQRLLTYGTLLCSAIIAVGVMLDALDAQPSSIDLVTVGIVGFICLPVLRILSMLRHYVATKDVAMTRVVALVLAIVGLGLIFGILL